MTDPLQKPPETFEECLHRLRDMELPRIAEEVVALRYGLHKATSEGKSYLTIMMQVREELEPIAEDSLEAANSITFLDIAIEGAKGKKG